LVVWGKGGCVEKRTTRFSLRGRGRKRWGLRRRTAGGLTATLLKKGKGMDRERREIAREEKRDSGKGRDGATAECEKMNRGESAAQGSRKNGLQRKLNTACLKKEKDWSGGRLE